MSEADFEVAGVEALWPTLGSVVLLTILLITWLRKGSTLLPELSTKAVLITGCDSGFGHELAKRLDTLGVTVFAGCLFPGDSGGKDLKSACSNRLHVLHLDVTREEHVRNAVRYVKNSLGNKTLWAVVNNAGIFKLGFMEWMDTETVKKVFEVNAIGPVTVTNAFLPLLKISHGRVIIVSSLLGRLIFPGIGVYCMSKHAATALANVLRFELKQWGITLHDFQPGPFRTNMTNLEFSMKELESRWIQLPEEVRASYGQNYLEKCRTLMSYGLEAYFVSKKTYQVVDDLQDAVVGKSPKDIYHPGLRHKLIHSLIYLGPIHQLMVWIILFLLRKE
jgi:NAD(P)-dependent dehydrogenase (short-subunit alcohol dehydrogenase family)